MLDMKHRLIKQLRDVIVVQGVDDMTALAFTDHQAQIAQLTQLMRDRRGLHPHRVSEIAHRAWTFPQAPQDLHAAWRRQDLHPLRDQPSKPYVDRCGRLVAVSVTHLNV